MALLQRLLFGAARKLASNPEARRKAAEVYRDQVKPAAEKFQRRAKPKVEAAKAELRDMAKNTDPRAEPAKFAGRLTRRLMDKARGK